MKPEPPRRPARIPPTRPDVALLDVRLPDGDGVDGLPGDPVPPSRDQCLMLTSFSDDEALFDAIMAGASGLHAQADQERGDRPGGPLRAEGSHCSIPRSPAGCPNACARRRKRTSASSNSPVRSAHPRAIADGLTNRQIAGQDHLAEKTVKNYVSNLLTKWGWNVEPRPRSSPPASAEQRGDRPRNSPPHRKLSSGPTSCDFLLGTLLSEAPRMRTWHTGPRAGSALKELAAREVRRAAGHAGHRAGRGGRRRPGIGVPGELCPRPWDTSCSGRTKEPSSTLPVPARTVTFEVDRSDPMYHTGWSVMAIGPLQAVTDPTTSERVQRPAGAGLGVHRKALGTHADRVDLGAAN